MNPPIDTPQKGKWTYVITGLNGPEDMTDQDFNFDKIDMKDWLKLWPTFQATGKTYNNRDELTSWGWFWNAEEKAWETTAEDEDDPCVRAIMALPGVIVKRRSP